MFLIQNNFWLKLDLKSQIRLTLVCPIDKCLRSSIMSQYNLRTVFQNQSKKSYCPNGWYSLCSDRFALEHSVLTVLSRHYLHWCQTCIDHHFVLANHALANFELWHILHCDQFWTGHFCTRFFCALANFVLRSFYIGVLCPGQFCTQVSQHSQFCPI